MVDPQNIHTSTIIQKEQVIYVYTCMHLTPNLKKRSHKFERVQEVIYGRIWRKKWEGKKDVIILLTKVEKKQKENAFFSSEGLIF